jgi:hypothetical protein
LKESRKQESSTSSLRRSASRCQASTFASGIPPRTPSSCNTLSSSPSPSPSTDTHELVG